MKWSTALELGRVSNLPTVWTNTLAGVVLAGGTLGDPRLPLLLVALSLFYVGGMFLNDAFDREFDARHRRDRPIPSGQVTAEIVFKSGFGLLAAGLALLAWLGFGVAGGTGWPPVAAGVALGTCIVFYDGYHKQNLLGPVVMGLCRMLVYVVAATAIAGEPSGTALAMGLLLLAYIVGLTYAARQEHLDRLGNLWPIACLALPLLWGAWAARTGAAVALLWLLLCGWVVHALSFLRRRRAGDVPRAIGHLLAGISLWDALVIAAAGQPVVALLAVAGFALTLVLQRYVAPT
jgi:4-hydroxybenzoate polyprenyltransferase